MQLRCESFGMSFSSVLSFVLLHHLLPMLFILRFALFSKLALCFAMLYYAMLCYTMLCYTILCYAMLCYTMLCYAVLCHAMLCYAMLCYTMPCYAILCYARLCNAIENRSEIDHCVSLHDTYSDSVLSCELSGGHI